jgi:hypothetical protein
MDHALDIQAMDTTMVTIFKAKIDITICFCCFIKFVYRATVMINYFLKMQNARPGVNQNTQASPILTAV